MRVKSGQEKIFFKFLHVIFTTEFVLLIKIPSSFEVKSIIENGKRMEEF